ncbi:D-alanyl-D-alanine carboxypeptidase family protein [Pseudobacteroides cellulosolvens]|uniref:serine-type D-Ala-D-Ala carboxypeptidase n=1 Tax=Pseudobacteroides cellulosolvens ATCC 35603 = DSM 2933 TaxID=398512 RepID=A0A0L6JRU8_9FIRM|nr:D-alanyl-D-alanine carboxypeptidase family protein [Pseudobacteroides cellulosolvens]KNY28420.1 Serine-type D-Ala-D-Ala carboxypeptidase [Pseudobacteroides cellulosolvens ATCC 35603 = DSM 2933]
MIKRILLFLQVCLIIASLGSVAYSQPVNIPSSYSYILMDSKTGQVLVENNADVKLRPASTTKIMTAILAVENGKMDSIMNVSQNAVYDIGPGGMNIGIMAGESNLTLENMLNAMLVRSANETANIIAENISGSKEEFAKRMNEKAQELGAYNTNFVNPCGKDDAKGEENHLSTARDMALIARYAMTKPEIREIVAKEYYKDLPATNKHQKWDPLRSTNKLLWYSNKYPYTLDGQKHNYEVNGIKTGYTSAAGNNLVSSAVGEDGLELIAVVMHVTEGNNKVFSYTKELYKYGFEHFVNKKLVSANDVLKSIAVENSKNNEKLDLVAETDFSCATPIDSADDLIREEKIQPSIKAPVKKGDKLGVVEYKKNGVLLGTVNVVASRDIEKPVVANTDNEQVAKSENTVRKILIPIIAICGGFLVLRFVMKRLSRRARRMNSL